MFATSSFVHSYGPWIITLLGIAHAIAGFCYFSKARYGVTWAVAWLVLTIVSVLLLQSAPTTILTVFGLALAAWTAWWMTMRPSNERRWVSENSQLGKGTFSGETLTIENVRNFKWQGKGRHEASWETRSYNLNELDAADLYVSTWGSPHIAHMLISFTFKHQTPLCFSIETRRERTERWSSLAGFFKAYEIMIIPGDELDHVQVRTNIRKERVRLYRLDVDRDTAKKLLEVYVRDMNALHDKPRFYHTLWTNCTTEIARLVRAIGIKTPLDWRLILTGHVPKYLYAQGTLGRALPFDALDKQADIGERARAADPSIPFHEAIRIGLHDPRFANARAANPSQAPAGTLSANAR
jgi:hypothetical protein